MNKKKYVAGFLFSYDQRQVVLLKKARPAWQAGRYNAVGGKIELNETPAEAMQREFFEETGALITAPYWKEFTFLEGPDWECTFFRAWGDVSRCQTQDPEEPIKVFLTNAVKVMTPEQSISNVPWLLGIALNTSGGIKLPVKVQYQ